MSDYLIKRSSFTFFAFGDSVSEKDFEGKEFKAYVSENKVVFQLKLQKKLDYYFFYDEKKYYDTYVFDESFVIKKVIDFLEDSKEYDQYCFRILDRDSEVNLNLTTIKVQTNAIVFQAFP